MAASLTIGVVLAITITGEVKRTAPDANGKLRVTIVCQMNDAKGNELGSFRTKFTIDQTSDTARLLGVDASTDQPMP